MTRVAIVGAGAMGGIFGGRLAAAGSDVTLLDVSQSLVDHVARDGLTVVRDGTELVARPRATVDGEGVQPVDVAFVFVKCYQTASALERAAPLLDEGTTVVSLQNGWGNGELLSRIVDPRRLLVGVTYRSGTVLGLGRVLDSGRGATFIGPYDGAEPERAAAVHEALERAGFEVSVVGDVRTEIWKKLVLNAATLPTAALTGLAAGALGRPGPMRDLVDGVARETVLVARAIGLDLDERERIGAVHTVLEGAGESRASMLQDLEAGRRTEIDVITGAVVQSARAQHVPAPLNEALLALIKGHERARGLA